MNDVQVYYTPAGQAVASFDLPVENDDSVQAQNLSPGSGGRTAGRRNFIPVIARGKVAEGCRQYLKKGNELFVEGILQNRNYNTSEGERKMVLEVVAEKIESKEVQSSKLKAKGK